MANEVIQLETKVDQLENLQEQKLDISHITQAQSITTSGYVVDARELNAGINGSIVNKISSLNTAQSELSNKLASLNNAYFIRKTLTNNVLFNTQTWNEISAFSYIVPEKSIVIGTVVFEYTMNVSGFIETFFLETFFNANLSTANAHDRFTISAARIANKNELVTVNVYSSPERQVTIIGNSDIRFAKADYVIIPLK